MNLYIVRHGHADGGSPDSERRLTEFGRDKLMEAMPTWQTYIDEIDLILTSPYKRALESSEIIHSYFKVKNKLIIDSSLQPGMNISNTMVDLSSLEHSNIMVVGHMPDVSDLVAELVASSSFGYPFSPGTLAVIEFEGKLRSGAGKLTLLLQERK